MTTVAIRYIGSKEEKVDNVAGTGKVWRGEGDVQVVDEKAAAKLLKHTDVWEPAEGQGEGAETDETTAAKAPKAKAPKAGA